MKKLLLLSLLNLCIFNGHSQQWILQSSFPAIELNDIYFLNEYTGYVFGDSAVNGTFVKGLVMVTNDQGNTWTELPMGSPNYRIFDSYFIGSDIFAAGRSAAGGGNTGLFVKSPDGGSTWINPTTFPERLFTTGFINPLTGWVGGKNGFLAETTDGGVTWSAPMNLTGEDIFDIEFFNSTTGLIVCGGGEIYRTADGGSTWLLVASNTPEDLTAVAIAGNNLAYVCGTAGTMIISNDAGLTWNLQSTTTGFDLSTISFYDAANGFSAGAGGTMVHTASSGQPWSVLTGTCIDDISSMYCVDANSGWFCTIEGDIYKLTNPTGLSTSHTATSDFRLGPNPASTTVTIELPEGKYELKIYSYAGELCLYEKNLTQQSLLDISQFRSGAYVAEAVNSTTVYRTLLIKE